MVPTFLIADDSPGKTAMLREILRKNHWKGDVLIAETTEEAMRLIDEHSEIGFAWVDYYIPSSYGPAVIAYLKEKNPAARIALVSSVDREDNNAEAIRAGAEACVCTNNPTNRVDQELMRLLENWRHAVDN